MSEQTQFNGLHTDEEINGNAGVMQEETTTDENGVVTVNEKKSTSFIKTQPEEEVK